MRTKHLASHHMSIPQTMTLSGVVNACLGLPTAYFMIVRCMLYGAREYGFMINMAMPTLMRITTSPSSAIATRMSYRPYVTRPQR